MDIEYSNPELERIKQSPGDDSEWRKWGPYLSDRAWGTVREDYSENGDAWNYVTHNLARSKAFRWNDDGIAGICDRFQLLVFAPAFWNGVDPILKERLFGLTPLEGNHGEDVKEYYFHQDSTPTHSYMKFLYKYSQNEFPYQNLINENQRRAGQGFEYELLDTGVFDDNRYFDIVIEYAKYGPDDIGIRIEAFNRSDRPAPLYVLPHLWFRNTWAWSKNNQTKPEIKVVDSSGDHMTLAASLDVQQLGDDYPEDYQLGPKYLHLAANAELLFTDNETNPDKFSDGSTSSNSVKFFKDAFHETVVENRSTTNPDNVGTKFAGHFRFPAIQPGESAVVRCRLSGNANLDVSLDDVDNMVLQRKKEADVFYGSIGKPGMTDHERSVQRAAFAGLFWSKQNYMFDVEKWLEGDNADKNFKPRKRIRNENWKHLNSKRILTMPDKWEYPWFAAWDLAFHCVPFALADPAFAKEQLELMLFEQFLHPNGQIPAYEWEFSDVNPPVHAWAVWKVFNTEKFEHGNEDYVFLEKCFHKLLLNFNWWINKVDVNGNNVFEGGFLGLDNISVLDRSEPRIGDAIIEQADATGWMAMFAQQMMRIALELAKRNPVYESLATKFFQHYIYIAAAMKKMGPGHDCQLWDEADGFFYDMIRFPDGHFEKFRVRSLVGIIPLFAVERLEMSWLEPFKEFRKNLDWFLRNREDLVADVLHTVEHPHGTTHVLTVARPNQIQRILKRVWDENEFLSDYGIRSLSKYHEHNPFEFNSATVRYEPAEAISKLKGGNSNWRGPIWFPTNYLLIDSLRRLGKAFGDQLTFEASAVGSNAATANDLARDLALRLKRLFSKNDHGRRPWCTGCNTFADDPHWKDLQLFHEYFNGENGAGLGASHQTGWTALIANIIDEYSD